MVFLLEKFQAPGIISKWPSRRQFLMQQFKITTSGEKTCSTSGNRDVAAAPQTPIGGAQANFGGPS